MAKDLNFLPEDYLEKRAARRTNLFCLTLFALMLACVGGGYYVWAGQDKAVRTEQTRVNERFGEAARQLEKLEQLQTQKAQMVRKAHITSVLVERVPRSLILAELINHMPVTLSLTDLEMATETVRQAARPQVTSLQLEQQRLAQKQKSEQGELPEIKLPETDLKMVLMGVAPTDLEVSQFIGALNAHELFRHVSLQYSEQTEVEEQAVRKFRIELSVNQDIDLSHLTPTRVSRKLKQNPMDETVRLGNPAAPAGPQESKE